MTTFLLLWEWQKYWLQYILRLKDNSVRSALKCAAPENGRTYGSPWLCFSCQQICKHDHRLLHYDDSFSVLHNESISDFCKRMNCLKLKSDHMPNSRTVWSLWEILLSHSQRVNVLAAFLGNRFCWMHSRSKGLAVWGSPCWHSAAAHAKKLKKGLMSGVQQGWHETELADSRNTTYSW